MKKEKEEEVHLRVQVGLRKVVKVVVKLQVTTIGHVPRRGRRKVVPRDRQKVKVQAKVQANANGVRQRERERASLVLLLPRIKPKSVTIL